MQPYLPEFYTTIITISGIIIGLAGIVIVLLGTVALGPKLWRLLMMIILSISIFVGIVAIFQALDWFLNPIQTFEWIKWLIILQLLLFMLPLVAFISTFYNEKIILNRKRD